MTNEKAIERIKAFSVFLTGGNPIWDVDECKEAFDIALAAMSERNLDEWCDNCKEYDHDRHCCHRFNRVIRETVEEVKQNAEQKWISCKERLPKEEKMQYWVCTDTGYQCQCRWTNDVYGLGASDEWEWKIFDIPQYQKVVAWMPLPEPWRGEEDE